MNQQLYSIHMFLLRQPVDKPSVRTSMGSQLQPSPSSTAESQGDTKSHMPRHRPSGNWATGIFLAAWPTGHMGCAETKWLGGNVEDENTAKEEPRDGTSFDSEPPVLTASCLTPRNDPVLGRKDREEAEILFLSSKIPSSVGKQPHEEVFDKLLAEGSNMKPEEFVRRPFCIKISSAPSAAFSSPVCHLPLSDQPKGPYDWLRKTSQSLSYLDDQAKREILIHNNIQISQPYVLMESFIQGASTSISQVTITMVPETQCGKLWPTGYNTSSLIVTKGLPLSAIRRCRCSTKAAVVNTK
ncbi:hypothetical protein MG293_002026 [Ovis ammon polii]|uniref:Uncharacterized protein n=1 Tax=Ovis ammon polii TaxID=230172 RepID=A0AAD4UP25_OVIAM|nr:hypothetical protein MG293_002026 [Ovis ammon polii]